MGFCAAAGTHPADHAFRARHHLCGGALLTFVALNHHDRDDHDGAEDEKEKETRGLVRHSEADLAVVSFLLFSDGNFFEKGFEIAIRSGWTSKPRGTRTTLTRCLLQDPAVDAAGFVERIVVEKAENKIWIVDCDAAYGLVPDVMLEFLQGERVVFGLPGIRFTRESPLYLCRLQKMSVQLRAASYPCEILCKKIVYSTRNLTRLVARGTFSIRPTFCIATAVRASTTRQRNKPHCSEKTQR